MNHTPLPWRASAPDFPNQRRIEHVSDSDVSLVCRINEGNPSADANTEFILRAVNSYEAMLSILTTMFNECWPASCPSEWCDRMRHAISIATGTREGDLTDETADALGIDAGIQQDWEAMEAPCTPEP